MKILGLLYRAKMSGRIKKAAQGVSEADGRERIEESAEEVTRWECDGTGLAFHGKSNLESKFPSTHKCWSSVLTTRRQRRSVHCDSNCRGEWVANPMTWNGTEIQCASRRCTRMNQDGKPVMPGPSSLLHAENSTSGNLLLPSTPTW